MKIKMLVVVTGMLFFHGPLFADLDPLENYDNFNRKKVDGCKYCIDSDKWHGGHRGAYNAEVSRDIKSKRLHMTHRSWADDGSDAGREQGRNRVIFNDSVDISGACITPWVKKYEINNCPTNPAPGGSVRIRYLGNFYDTGAADDQEVGVVYAGISLQRDGNFPSKKGKFYVAGWASECLDALCESETWNTGIGGIEVPDLFFGTVKGSKNKKEICVGYDRANHEIVFSYGNDVRTVNAADHGLPAFANDLAESQTWHTVEVRVDVENCTSGRQSGYIEGYVDNVKVRRFGP